MRLMKKTDDLPLPHRMEGSRGVPIEQGTITKATGGKAQEERIGRTLSYRALIWRRFLRNRMAVVSICIIALLYLSVLPAELTAPYGPHTRNLDFIGAPPQRIRFIDGEGRLHLRPFVYGLRQERDPRTLRRRYVLDTTRRFPLGLFVRGEGYRFGFFQSNLHLVGVKGGYLFLMGTDKQGRDLFSRVIYGGRVSMTVGLVGVVINIVMGTLIGLISGYFGGRVDDIIQRGIEVLLSFPSIPLWMALSAAVPNYWSPIRVFFAVTIILSLLRWGSLARVVRGMTLSLKSEEFILAARVNGGTTWWILIRHLLPGNVSYVIVAATLAIPAMILGETALSFLGLGIRPPMVSWGVLLQQAQDVTVIAQQPWQIIPVAMVVLSVLAFNFMGDGLRDAVDPLSKR
jgi:peptide/nickel transport system permease protein